MKKSIKLQIRMSELRSEVNKLEPGDQNLAKRKELLGEIETAETEYRTALTEEANDPGNEHRADGLTAEEREFRSLDTRAELRNAFGAILNGAELAGPELELQRHRGFSGSELPWDLIAPRAKVVPVEHRVDAATPAPASAQDNQRTPLGRVFARSATATLGVDMPSVPTGDLNVPVLSAGATAAFRAKDGSSGDAAAGTIDAVTFTPKRLQTEYILRREDRARLLGLDELLRSDLSMEIANRVDAQVLAGDGSAPNLGGFLSVAANGGLPALANGAVVLTYALGLVELNRGVDGTYAGSTQECSMVVGDDTYRKLGSVINDGSGETGTMAYSRMLGRFMASANMTAPDADNQQGIIAKLGAGTNAICPMWGGVVLIVDEVSSALRKKGWISLTVVLLSDFKITRKDGFTRSTFHLA